MIDGSYIYRAYKLDAGEDNGDSGLVEGHKISQIASQRIYTIDLKHKFSREFHSSKNFMIVVNQLDAIDLFKFTEGFQLEYLASLKHQFTPMSFARGKLELLGNPIVSIFQRRPD